MGDERWFREYLSTDRLPLPNRDFAKIKTETDIIEYMLVINMMMLSKSLEIVLPESKVSLRFLRRPYLDDAKSSPMLLSVHRYPIRL